MALLDDRWQPIIDLQFSDYMASKSLILRSTLDASIAFEGADLATVATLTGGDQGE